MMSNVFTPGTIQNRATGAASAQSNAFGDKVHTVRLCATVACYIKFGVNPTATNTDIYMPPGIPEYFAVRAGEKLAAIQDTAAGKLSIVEIAT